MMVKMARLTGQEVIAALQKAGFEVLRVKGSHHFFESQRRQAHSRPHSSRRNCRTRFDVENLARLRDRSRRLDEIIKMNFGVYVVPTGHFGIYLSVTSLTTPIIGSP